MNVIQALIYLLGYVGTFQCFLWTFQTQKNDILTEPDIKYGLEMSDGQIKSVAIYTLLNAGSS